MATNGQALNLDVQAEFDRINTRYFGGELSATAQWSALPTEYGKTTKSDQNLILIDRTSFRTPDEIRQTIEHEACHVFDPSDTDNKEHGPISQACMARFK
jgi:hypothetical protein